MIKTLLIFPPVWEPSQPYLALPTLKGWLRQNGYEARQWDLNILFHDTVIATDYLTNLFLARSRPAGIPADELRRWLHEVVPRIDWAKAVLRSQAYYEPESFIEAKSVLEKAYGLLSELHAPTQLTATSFVMRYRASNSREVAAATCDEAENPFIRFYQKHVLPGILAEPPDVLGLSIADVSQIIPGLTLARLVRELLPSVHITIGGTLFSKFGEALRQTPSPALDLFFHSVVRGEGEAPLLKLLQTLESGGDLAAVPGLIYRDAQGQVQINELGIPPSMDEIPPPDFDDLPLERYFAPELILPMLASRDCYWKDCAFCDHYITYAPRYRLRKPAKTAADMAFLAQRYGTRLFSFGDETMSPNYARHLSEAIRQQGLAVRWSMLSRLQKGFDPETCALMQQGGCSLAIFGLESASPRLSQFMQKGLDLDVARQVYRNLDAAGICNYSFIFFGFPTETLAEARETEHFVLEQRDVMHAMGVGCFSLKKFAPMFQQLERYGISALNARDLADDWSVDIGYEVSQGMTAQDADSFYRQFIAYLWELYRGPLWLVDGTRSAIFLYACRYGKDWLRQQDFRDKVTLRLPVYA